MRLSQLFVPLFVLAATGCGAHYNFVKKADPNPFVGKSHFSISAPDFSKATVDGTPLATWQSKEELAKDWGDNSANAVKEFFEELSTKKGSLAVSTGAAGPDDVQVVPWVESFVPGYYIGIAAKPTTVVMHYTLLSGGVPADEVVIQQDIRASLYTPSFNQRLANNLRAQADQLIEYLQWRSSK